MPVTASATRWAPVRTRSTRAVLIVLSPVCSLAGDSFRFDDTIQGQGPGSPRPHLALKRSLGNGRELARVLLRLARRALAGLVRRVLVRHERARAGRRGRGGGDRRRAGRAGGAGGAGAQWPSDRSADDTAGQQ